MTKYSLMIGLNYHKTSMELNGCINDIHTMKDVCTKYLGMKEYNITIMHDKLPTSSEFYPNRMNIRKQLNNVIGKCKAGDICLLHYSGHGVKSNSTFDVQECIYPVDALNGKTHNYVCEEEISTIVSKLHKDASLFILSDSCNTKSIVDFTYVVSNDSGNKDHYYLKKRNNQKFPDGPEMVCLTATSGDEKAYDVVDKDGKAYGVLTHTFCEMIKQYIKDHKPLYYLDILTELTEKTKNYKQTPILSFSKQACLTCPLSIMFK